MADDSKEKGPNDLTPTPSDAANATNPVSGGGIPIPPLGVNPQQAIAPMMALQLGVGMQGQPQNPEVMKHMTEFLTHDSDNKLSAIESSGKRNHTFRMTGLLIGAGLVFFIVVVPILVQLFKGDMTFVDKMLTSYLPVLGAVLLALFAGPKISEFFKG